MTEHPFNPQLRAARFLPRTVISSRTLPTARLLTKLAGITQRPDAQAVSVDADVSVHVFRPASARHPKPALLWIHGGGMVLGTAAQDSRFCRRIADQLDIVVASVEYRATRPGTASTRWGGTAPLSASPLCPPTRAPTGWPSTRPTHPLRRGQLHKHHLVRSGLGRINVAALLANATH